MCPIAHLLARHNHPSSSPGLVCRSLTFPAVRPAMSRDVHTLGALPVAFVCYDDMLCGSSREIQGGNARLPNPRSPPPARWPVLPLRNRLHFNESPLGGGRVQSTREARRSGERSHAFCHLFAQALSCRERLGLVGWLHPILGANLRDACLTGGDLLVSLFLR
jgi:hypothetical protein